MLKLRLEEADNDKAALEQVKKINEHNQITINDLNEKLDKYKKLDERNAGLEAREAAVIEGERKLEVDTLKYQLESEKEKVTFTKEVALGLVKNVTYRESIFDAETRNGYYDSNNVWHPDVNTSRNYSKDVTKE